MKTWNTPELQELDVRLTATGEDGDLYEEEETTMLLCDAPKKKNPKPSGSGSGDCNNKPSKPGDPVIPEFS